MNFQVNVFFLQGVSTDTIMTFRNHKVTIQENKTKYYLKVI